MLRALQPYESTLVAEARATSFGTRDARPHEVAAVAALLDEHLVLGDLACFVVEDGGKIVSFGIGLIHQRLPAAHNPSGRWGWVQSMETHPAHRRKGHGAAILVALQDWYRERGVPAAMLVASDMGEPLYRSHGFVDDPFGTPLIWFAGQI